MNPQLTKLHLYPFEKLRRLLAQVQPDRRKSPIDLSIGEPKHPVSPVILDALAGALAGIATYPTIHGSHTLRRAIADWCRRRYDIELEPDREVVPVNGTREALFSFAHATIDPSQRPLVVAPNPFYQIYEGAARLGGAELRFLNTVSNHNYGFNLAALTVEEWARVQLLYVCSPSNPTGKVLQLADWRTLFELADRFGFIIASDECYSEIYFDECRPPLGVLQAAKLLGRNWERLVMFSSLSKRSNVPGMRSGFVAGDPEVIQKFLLYRSYHGCSIAPPIQAASVVAWNDEEHVRDNRRQYLEKFDRVMPLLGESFDTVRPDAGFYAWARIRRDVGQGDVAFVQRLFEASHVSILPGSFMSRHAHGMDPGAGYVRIALVSPVTECLEAVERITQFVHQSRRRSPWTAERGMPLAAHAR